MYYINQSGEQIELSASEEKWLDDSYLAAEMAKLPPNAPRAGLAYRASSKGQVDHDDIPLQKIECRRFCIEHGWRVALEKFEKGISGSKVSAAKRDAIQELKAEAEKKTFEILLVFMFDRLGRIEEETPFLLQWFVKHGVQMWSTREGQQRLDNHSDKLMNYIRFWQAAGESEKISERVSARMKQLNSSGHFSGGQVAYGYQAVYKGRTNKKDQPVKDLEIDPIEAAITREVFEKIAYEGYSSYAIADLLNQRGLKTHGGAEFKSNHILRMVRHEGYTGYIITRNARSDYIPELEIIDAELFQKANEVVTQRCATNAENRRLAQKVDNNTLLAGIVYCAHCGARMSGFMHKDRYKLKNGDVVERYKAKYNCFQRAQKLRECDGQALYLAENVDEAVLKIVHTMFDQVRQAPCDRTLEQRIRRNDGAQRQHFQALEKRIRECKHALERYENEVLKCLDGYSNFSQEVLARLIAKAEQELKTAQAEYAKAGAEQIDEEETAKKIRTFYREFKGWAEEFDIATLERKRMILSQLIDRVEVGKGYKITIHVRLSYQQFLEMCEAGERKEVGVA